MALSVAATLGVKADENRAQNGGFEQTVELPESHPYAKKMRESWTIDTPIISPQSWVPNPIIKQGEFRLMRDKAQTHSGDVSVFLKGDLAQDEHIDVQPGDNLTIQFWARAREPGARGARGARSAAGPGKVDGVFYVYGKNAEGKPALGYDAFHFTEAVDQDWKKYRQTFAIPDQLQECRITTVVPVLRSLTGAFFDDVEVQVNKPALEDLVIIQPDQTANRLAVFNGGFEDWQVVAPSPANWDLNQGWFPNQWLGEKRPGETGLMRRMINSGEDRKRFGGFSLLLNGRLVSEKMLDPIFNKVLNVSFWARGTGGHVDLRVRLYDSLTAKPEAASQLGRLVEIDTQSEWKEYTGTMLAYGNNIYSARLELIGQGVVIDNLRVVVSEKVAADQEEPDALISAQANSAAVPPLKWRLEHYPVQGKINIRLLGLSTRSDLQAGKHLGSTRVFVYQANQLVLEKTVDKPLIVGDEGHITVPFSPQEDGVFLVRAIVCDDQGDGLDAVSGTVEKKTLLWLGNSLGKDPGSIVPPFTAMQTKQRTVSCLGRNYQLGESGLPEAITARGEQLLAAPMTFEMEDELGNHSGKPVGGELLDRAADHVTFQGETSFAGLDVKIKGLAEYDGVLRYEVDLLPQADISVKSFSLNIPVNGVKYMHAANGMRTQTTMFAMALPGPGEYRDAHVPLWTPGHVYQATSDPITLYLPTSDGVIWNSRGISTPGVVGNFMPYLWIGNARFGLSWSADNDRGWSQGAESTCLELIRRGATTTLRVHFIAQPVKLSAPRKFVFSLLATPVKPRRAGGTILESPIMGFGMQFQERWNSLRFADAFLANNLKKMWNQTNKSALIYIANDLFNSHDPVMKSLKDEWVMRDDVESVRELLPMKPYGTEPRDYLSSLVCAGASRVDYQIARLDRCMREGAIDGVYLDNSFPAVNSNIQHANGGYIRGDGQVQGGYHLTETRDLVKRTATLAHQHRCHWPALVIHSTSAMVIPSFTSADLCVDGEWDYQGKDFMDFFPLPYLEVFGAGAWGINQGWLPKLHGMENETKPTRTMLAALKLYDMWIWNAHCNAGLVQKYIDLEKAFGVSEKDCRFVGYWDQDDSAVAGLPVDVKSSYYVRNGKGALIYVANFNPKQLEISVRLDFEKWGLGAATTVDGETNQKLALTSGALHLTIEGHDFRLIRLEKK